MKKGAEKEEDEVRALTASQPLRGRILLLPFLTEEDISIRFVL